MLRNVSEHGERVVVPGGGVRCWCQVVVPRWWCPLLVPAAGVGWWCRVPLSGAGAQAPAFGAQRSMSFVRSLVF